MTHPHGQSRPIRHRCFVATQGAGSHSIANPDLALSLGTRPTDTQDMKSSRK